MWPIQIWPWSYANARRKAHCICLKEPHSEWSSVCANRKGDARYLGFTKTLTVVRSRSRRTISLWYLSLKWPRQQLHVDCRECCSSYRVIDLLKSHVYQGNRFPLPTQSHVIFLATHILFSKKVHSVLANLPISDRKLLVVKREMETDEQFQLLKHTIING